MQVGQITEITATSFIPLKIFEGKDPALSTELKHYRYSILIQKKNVLDCTLYLLNGEKTPAELKDLMQQNPGYQDNRFFPIENIVNAAIPLTHEKFL